MENTEMKAGPAAFSIFLSITKDIINENTGFFNEKHKSCRKVMKEM
jgi:hypothetical protein